jgi:hypothetical protein
MKMPHARRERQDFQFRLVQAVRSEDLLLPAEPEGIPAPACAFGFRMIAMIYAAFL